ncbi:MAG: hypothetical protein DRO90_00350 [Candidatus Altiarchaeales archaeon]|nr:MAG: hypothetical protein DRO90_00350 [Candidatus Altiarchaeales archaeon]
MTYGWVILILILAVIVVWQMGLFNLGGYVRQGYAGFWGLVPTAGDFRFHNGDLELPLTNQVGGSVNITVVSATFQGVTKSDTSVVTLDPGESRVFQIQNLPSIPSGSRYDIFITINYTDDRINEQFTCSGWIWGTAE